MKIDTKALRTKLEELVLDQVRHATPGEEKLKSVIHAAAAWLAQQTPGVPDVIEIPVYRAILWIPAQFAYDHLKDLGKV